MEDDWISTAKKIQTIHKKTKKKIFGLSIEIFRSLQVSCNSEIKIPQSEIFKKTLFMKEFKKILNILVV